MKIDLDHLTAFEHGLNFSDLSKSAVSAKVLGYGEISSIFSIVGMSDIAFKRMPPFTLRKQAEKYALNYHVYCNYLRECGISLPEDETVIIPKPDGRVVLYIAQEQLPAKLFGHKLLHSLSANDLEELIKSIVDAIEGVWLFNKERYPDIRLAIDGQISNWVWMDIEGNRKLHYVDTSTPLFKLKGVEQLDPELFLKSAPSFLRGIIRALFLQEVMNHYYDSYGVYRDLAANLYKEQRPDLIPFTLQICNACLPREQQVTEKDVKKYYRDDSLTWSVFLASRKVDRWMQTKLLRKRYEYLLPGKIKR
jgi:hypothetical protein